MKEIKKSSQVTEQIKINWTTVHQEAVAAFQECLKKDLEGVRDHRDPLPVVLPETSKHAWRHEAKFGDTIIQGQKGSIRDFFVLFETNSIPNFCLTQVDFSTYLKIFTLTQVKFYPIQNFPLKIEPFWPKNWTNSRKKLSNWLRKMV